MLCQMTATKIVATIVSSVSFSLSAKKINGALVLADMSMMVKGIGSDDAPRPLFSATSQRPTSSHGLSIGKPKPKAVTDLSDTIDDTDYTKLVPQGSPQRPAPRNVNDTIIGGDSDSDSFGIVRSKAAAAKPKAPAKATKVAAKPVPKKSTAKAASLVPKKAVHLSPAAKAYAAKQGKAPVASKAAGKKKAVDSDEEMDDLANDLLSDEDDAPVKPAGRAAAAAAARPGRRAAATKQYAFEDEDDEDEDESEEPSFDDDDDMSD